jgi:hypothetical protein
MAYDINVLRALLEQGRMPPPGYADIEEALPDGAGAPRYAPIDFGQMERLQQPPMNVLAEPMRIPEFAPPPEVMPRTSLEDPQRYKVDGYDPQTDAASAMPMNALRNSQTGEIRSMNFGGGGQQQPQERLGERVQSADGRMGRYSADGRSIVYPDGSRVDLHPQRSAALAKQAEDRMKAFLGMLKDRQGLAKGDLEMEQTRAQTENTREQMAKSRQERMGQTDPNAPMKLTEVQGKAMTFGQRAAESHEILNSIGQDGKVQPGSIKRIAGSMPGLGMDLDQGLATMMNWTQSKEQQQVEQAQRNFVNAVLRRESGAVISPAEFANATQQYFPQPGDSQEVIAQKKRNREIVIQGLAEEAGPARGKVLGSWQQSRQQFATPKQDGAAAPPMASRVAGRVYQTPRGPMQWTGQGWLPAT